MKQYPDYKLYVALLGTEIVGMFCLLICDNFGHGCARVVIVNNVVIGPDYQRQDISKKMMLKSKLWS